MKVILNTDVQNLGEDGDVVDVAAGYARNFLLPRKLVSLHTPQNLSLLAARKVAIEKKKEDKRKAAVSNKEKIASLVLKIQMPAGDTGKLFGSVTSHNVADELARLGVVVERKKIEIPGHVIKHTGDFKAVIKLYGNESAELKIQISAASAAAKAQEVASPVEAPAAEAAAE